MAHPAWSEAGRSLGATLDGAIGLEPIAGRTLLMKIVAYGGIFLMALHFGRDRHLARLIYVAVALSAAGYALYGLIEFFGGWRKILWFDKTEYPGSLTSTFVNRNSYATYAGLGVVAALGPLLQEARRLVTGRGTWLRLVQNLSLEASPTFFLLLAAVLLGIFAVVLTGSRGGFMATAFGLFVFMVLMVALRDIGVRQFVAVLVLAVASIFGFLALGGGSLVNRLSTEQYEARVDLFDVARLAAAERPLVGHGLAGFPAAFNRANDGSAVFDNSWVDLAHNSYLELVIEGGMIGLIGSLALLGLTVGLMLQGVFTRARGTSFAIAGLAACALVGAHAMIDFSVQMPAVAATFMLLVGAAAGQSLPGALARTNQNRNDAAESEADSERPRRRARERRPVIPTREEVAARAAALAAERGEAAAAPAAAEPTIASATPFNVDYGSALDRWRQVKQVASANARPRPVPLDTAEPHPDDAALAAPPKAAAPEPPAPAFNPAAGQPPTPGAWPGVTVPGAPVFDPATGQPPTPGAWPGAAVPPAPAEPVDDGLSQPAPDRPSAIIYELPRNRGPRDRKPG
ncbi:MAG: O-antigen ligase family protein [Alphaproteobacteria bacterium]|nr:O-antigen ligase family protein [Alphaproteobacteria bacterium]